MDDHTMTQRSAPTEKKNNRKHWGFLGVAGYN